MPLSCAKFRFCSGLAAIDALWPSGRAVSHYLEVRIPSGLLTGALLKQALHRVATLVFVFEMMGA